MEQRQATDHLETVRVRRRWRLLPVTLVLGLLVGTLGVALDALPASAATSPTAVTFVGSSQIAHATPTTWTVGFTSSASGALVAGNTITVTFPSSFTIPATPTIGLSAAFTGSGTATATAAAGVVTITLTGTTALAASTAATTADATAVSPASNVVITGLANVTFSGSSQVGGATGTTWTVGFTTGATGALVAGNTIT